MGHSLANRCKKRLKFKSTFISERITYSDIAAAKAILAKLVARLYAADHQELFGKHSSQLMNCIGGMSDDE